MMRVRKARAVVFSGLLFLVSAVAPADGGGTEEGGEGMISHPSNIPAVKAIEEIVLVPGDTHADIWLGPRMFWTPGAGTGAEPRDFHLFFFKTDRSGGDSHQEGIHFIAPSLPGKGESLAEWHAGWKRAEYPEALEERTDEEGFRFTTFLTWKFHAAIGKAIGFGHVLRHRGNRLSEHIKHVAIAYSVYDPESGDYTPWDSFRIEIDGEEKPCVASHQRVDLPNGDILLAFSVIKKLKGSGSLRWCGSARCRLEGSKISVVETGNLHTIRKGRGLLEPSMAEQGGTYYMTLRAENGHAYVMTSKDGLQWADPKPWCWDDGEPMQTDTTQSKFIARPEGLFLVYTRKTKDNKKTFRHRAPLFMAQVDPESVRLIRKTESVLLADNGLPLGNFKVYAVLPNETWVTTQEWSRRNRGKQKEHCDNLLARIVW